MEHAKQRKRKVFDEFQDALMQSVWLVDMPEDPALWSVKVVPYGRRRLLDAQFGSTTLYDKRGRQTNRYVCQTFQYLTVLFRYWSSLPGGGKKTNMGQTLLDGIFNDITRTFYVLDVLTWAGYDYNNCETDFRFYWLQQKMAELGNIKGSIKIVLIPSLEKNELSKVFYSSRKF